VISLVFNLCPLHRNIVSKPALYAITGLLNPSALQTCEI
jgi:hypothetical protein